MNATIRRSSALFLQAVVVLIGVAVLAFLLWEPNVEGVNANATTFADIYLDDPFLAYAYASSIAFFMALYQAFKLFGYAGHNRMFSEEAVNALRTIQYCAGILGALIAGAVAYIAISMGGQEDIAGGIAMGLFGIAVSVAIGLGATAGKRIVQKNLAKRSDGRTIGATMRGA